MIKLFFAIAAGSGLLAVVLGAFGAHGLRDKLSPTLMSAFETGVQYHFYHTLALIAVALWLQRSAGNSLLIASGFLFVAGLLLFSGSLYLLALGGPRWLGPVTPVGGLAFMAAWLLMFIAALRS